MHLTHHDNPAHFGVRTKDFKLIFFYGVDYTDTHNGNVVENRDGNRFWKDTPAGWLPVSQASKELGVSKQTVLNWVKAGKLAYMYVNKGRKKGLRIKIKSVCYRKQISLFSKSS